MTMTTTTNSHVVAVDAQTQHDESLVVLVLFETA